MIPDQKFSDSIAAWRAIEDAAPEMIADVACAIWRDIGIALAPVIGTGGVEALLKRSIHLLRVGAVVKGLHKTEILPSEFSGLHAALAKATSSESFAINSEMLNVFYELLTKLIGDVLTHQLLVTLVDARSSDDLKRND